VTSKPCERCGGGKGPAYARKKHCGKCAPAVRRERSDRAHRARVAAIYGIQPEDYDRMYEVQGGTCAICQRAKGVTKRLAVDHDHKTDLVRGLLCGLCNKFLGHGRDEPEFFERAAEYLRNPPASFLRL